MWGIAGHASLMGYIESCATIHWLESAWQMLCNLYYSFIIPWQQWRVSTSVADPDPGSGIRCLFDPWIRDPGRVESKNPDPESGIRDEQPGTYFLELRNHFFGLKYLNSLMRIRDPGWKNSDPGSGMEKFRIRDPGWTTRIIFSRA